MGMDDATQLNLYNFEDEEFAESRYVLTSPRSLMACDMLTIKPAQLLYKPLSEFQDELLPTGIPLRNIYDQYDTHERQRLKSLRECREYRDKMIKDGMYKMLSSPISAAEDMMSSPRYAVDKLTQDDAGYRSADSLTGSPRGHKSSTLLSAHDRELRDAASLQRQRTADVLRRQSHTMTHLTARPKSALDLPISGVDRTPYPIRPRSTSPTRARTSPIPTQIALTRSPSTHQTRPVTPSRSVSFSTDSLATSSTKPKARTTSKKMTARSTGTLQKTLTPKRRGGKITPRSAPPRDAWRSPRYDEAEISTQLSRSLNLSDLNRSHDLHGTHLRSKSLRRSLGYDNTSGRVTQRDERILEALHGKNERDKELEYNKTRAQYEREEERNRYEREKNQSESTRRQILALRIAEAEEQQTLLRAQQKRDQEELRLSMIEKCLENDAKWDLSSARQQYKRELDIAAKRRRDHERKSTQERMLADFERQREEYLTERKHKSDYEKSKATSRKLNKYFHDKTKKKRDNDNEAEQHRQRYLEVERKADKSQRDLKSSLGDKEMKTLLNQSRINKAKEYTLHMNTKEREQKFAKSRANQQRMEEDMNDWKRSLQSRRRVLESKARLTASQTVELKALRAQAEREERESHHRQTYSKILAEAEINRRDQQDAIHYKNTKMKLVQHHKDNVIGQVRSLAANSQRMREELRRKYGKDSFDKVALETELQARIGRGHTSATKNKSTVLLA